MAAIVAMSLALPAAALAETITVTNGDDDGGGSFRDAVEQANANSNIDQINFLASVNSVALETTVAYTGTQSLEIDGRGATISADGADDLFVASGGADLYLKNIAFVEAGKSGVVVNVPAGAVEREQTVSLDNVVLHGNGWYGLHFDDQVGGDGTGADSASSLRLYVTRSEITNNNDPAIEPTDADKDGIRVDEGGDGDVRAVVIDSVLDDNSAEGIEIDEIGDGDVFFYVSTSSFDNNGSQPQDPGDLEDGLDVDEAGPGDIWLTILESSLNGNQDEGLDLDGAEEGNIYLSVSKVEASGNLDENIKVTLLQNTAANAGSIAASFTKSAVEDSLDGDGIKLEVFDNEDDENVVGSIFATVEKSSVVNNDSDDIQLEALTGQLVINKSDVDATDLTPGIAEINL